MSWSVVLKMVGERVGVDLRDLSKDCFGGPSEATFFRPPRTPTTNGNNFHRRTNPHLVLHNSLLVQNSIFIAYDDFESMMAVLRHTGLILLPHVMLFHRHPIAQWP